MALGLTNAAMKVVPGQMTLPYENVTKTPENIVPQTTHIAPPPPSQPTQVQNTTQGANASEQPLNTQNGSAQNVTFETSSTTTPPTPRKLDINDYLRGDTNLSEFLESYIKDEREKQEDYKAQEKRFKREKIYNSIGDAISALSNVFFASKGAPNMFDPKNSMTAKAQERYDKMIAERDKGRDNLIRLSQLQESLRQNDNNLRLAVEQFNQQAENNAFNQGMQREHMDETKKQNQWQQKHAGDVFDETKKQNQWQQEHADKQLGLEKDRMAQADRHFNANYSLSKQQLDMTRDSNSVRFALGNGETIDIPTHALNSQTVPYLFNKLPLPYKQDVHGRALMTKDDMGNTVPAFGTDGQPLYETPSNEDMLAAISTYMGLEGNNAEWMRREVRTLAGQTQTVSLGVSKGRSSGTVSLGVSGGKK